MLSHSQIWTAIDRLAERNELTPSGLARRAGLDPTTFNRSKRVAADGRERWPSTESVAKILQATSTPIGDFLGLLGGRMRRARTEAALRQVPLLGLAQAGAGGFFDDGGFPAGQGWDQIEYPGPGGDGAYALEVTGDSMLPLYRDGDIIIVSPAATCRRGDRVVVKTAEGRGDGQGTAAEDRQGDRACLAQPGPSQPHTGTGRYRMDGAHRVGEPVAERPGLAWQRSDATIPPSF